MSCVAKFNKFFFQFGWRKRGEENRMTAEITRSDFIAIPTKLSTNSKSPLIFVQRSSQRYSKARLQAETKSDVQSGCNSTLKACTHGNTIRRFCLTIIAAMASLNHIHFQVAQSARWTFCPPCSSPTAPRRVRQTWAQSPESCSKEIIWTLRFTSRCKQKELVI